jgi:hypothetical protein
LGLNFKSEKIKRLKEQLSRINANTDTPLTKQMEGLRRLLTISTISVRNCQWAKKYIDSHMRNLYRDAGTILEMDKLELLFQKAEERRARRKAKKLSARAEGAAAGTSGKRGRKRDSAPAPAAPNAQPYDPTDIWAEIIEEKKR